MRAPAPADGCGNCVTPDRTVLARPYLVQEDGDGIRAYYRCAGCGHRWWTCWMPGSGQGLLEAS